MTEAFIYDAVRTPRGKGKKTGSLHEVSPIHLVTTTLDAVRERNDLDTSIVDDVVLGCVEPVMDQGSNIARVAAIAANYDERVAGVRRGRRACHPTHPPRWRRSWRCLRAAAVPRPQRNQLARRGPHVAAAARRVVALR